MKLKRVLIFLIAGIFIFSVAPEFVSADPIRDLAQGVNSLLSGIFEIIREPLKIAVGEKEDVSSDWFMARVLFLLIIFSLVWVILDKVPFFEDNKNRWALWIVAISVSILSVRWLGEVEVIQSIILPYSAFGVAITAGLPFILFFFLVNDFSTPIRKVSWLFFGVIFLGLWYVRLDDLKVFGFASYIYLVTAILALGMFYFDGTIEKWKRKMKWEQARELSDARMRTKITLDRERLERARSRISEEDYKKQDAYLTKQEKRYGIG